MSCLVANLALPAYCFLCPRAALSSGTLPKFLRSSTEKNWGMRLVGVGDSLGDLKVINKTRMTEAHKGRLADVRKSKVHNAHPLPHR